MHSETTNPDRGVEYTDMSAELPSEAEDGAQDEFEPAEADGDLSGPRDDVDEGDGEDVEDAGDDEEDGDNGAVEIEYEGEVYRIPAQLKDAFLRNADYTRKTQTLAAERRKIEAERATAAKRDEVTAANIQDYARIVALSEQIQKFEAVNWQALQQQDPAAAQRLARDYAQAKQARNEAAHNFQQRVEQRSREEQQETARRHAEGRAVLSRDIPDWSPELGSVLRDYAVNKFGISPGEIGNVADPRLVKILYTALLGDLRGHRARQAAQASASLSAAQRTRPVPQVRSGGANATKNPAHMSDAEYIAWRAKGGGD
jgi:hypothetical protein